MKNHPKRASGFTLIELIVVIVILGVLAVTAAPKFINFKTDARVSLLKGLKGAVGSAMELTLAASIVKETASIGGGYKSLSLDGNTLFLTASGYPANWQQGLKYVVTIDATDWEIGELSNSVTLRPKGILTTEECYFQYDASDINIKPVLSMKITEC